MKRSPFPGPALFVFLAI